MKTKAFTFFLFLLPAVLCAQPDSSKFCIRLNGGYADVGSSNGLSSLGAVSSSNRQWEISLAAGYVIDKHWEIGLGFNYRKQKINALAEFDFPIPDQLWLEPDQQQWLEMLGMEFTETKMHLTTFDLYAIRNWRLFSRLYFTPKLTFRIGKAKGTQESVIVTSTGWAPILIGSNNDISYDYAALQLVPALTFHINRHFALNLELGSFQFSAIDWEWDNKQWEATVNPAYWRLGTVFSF
ncbi:MAG: hypothetical protein LBL24_00990 [Bacteroidales bacterium]|jgi:hypothetical protein|nr:hypothetical protein [Bacteroidales bacterium]